MKVLPKILLVFNKHKIISSLFPLLVVGAVFLLSVSKLQAQTKSKAELNRFQKKEYYDKLKKQPKTYYEVLKKKPSIYDGKYFSFYENGNVRQKGNYKNGIMDGEWGFYFENGNPSRVGHFSEGTPDGYWTYYYEGGLEKAKGNIENGKQSGEWFQYFENGKIKQKGIYKDGNQIGFWNYYHEDGSEKAVAYFSGDTSYYKEFFLEGGLKAEGILLNGVSHGAWTYYHQNGAKKATGFEKAGKKEGLWKFYFENDSLSAVGFFENGEETGTWEYFHPNGQINATGNYVDGQKEGKWNMYYETGERLSTTDFDNGDGDFVSYYPNGKVKTKGRILKGLNEGLWEYFSEDGKLEGKCTFLKGRGKYEGYYPDGAKRISGELKNNEKVGSWEIFNPDGSLVGLYTSFTEAAKVPMSFKTVKDSIKSPEKVTEQATMVKIKKKWRHFKKQINEPTGWILGTNPVAVVFNSLPFYIEYHWKNRLGYEASYTIMRTPFDADFSNPASNITHANGYSIGLKQKLYFEEDIYGSPYWAQEIRYSNQAISERVLPPGDTVFTDHNGTDSRVELSILAGTRFFKKLNNGHHLSVDLFIGLGYGLRTHSLSPDETIFANYDRRNYTIPFRLGFSIGYYLNKN